MAPGLQSPAKATATVVPSERVQRPVMPQYQSTGDLFLNGSGNAKEGGGAWRRRFSSVGWGTSLATAMVFSASAAWNAFLLALNLSPNATADALMLTGSLDNGRFWQFPTRSRAVSVTSTLLQLVVVALNVHLLAMVLRGPQRPRAVREKQGKLRELLRSAKTVARLTSVKSIGEKLPLEALRRRTHLYSDIVDSDGKFRKAWNVVLELPEVVLQALAMRSYMRHGLDEWLLYLYASLMATNAFLVVFHVLIAWRQRASRQIFHDAMFDSVFAVFFPALVLFYSVATFHSDLRAVKMLQQFFPPSAYERTGRIFVDARRINTFSAGYESLLLLDGRSILLQIGFNLLSCLRWHRIVRALLAKAQERTLQRQPGRSPSPTSAAEVAPHDAAALVPAVDGAAAPMKRSVPAVIGVVFLAYGVACVASAAVAIRSAQAACAAYASCTLVSYVWPPIGAPEADDTLLCNCLAFVDRNLAPNATEELPDVTLALAEVARAGSLESIQLVNRRLNGTLPDEVAGCTGLRSLILIYTGIETLPDWASETLMHLEYLHIQGSTEDDDSDEPNDLLELRDGLFSGMSELTTLQLSGHAYLERLPPLESLPKLETVFLGELESVFDLPALGDLPSLRAAAFVHIPRVKTLPDLSVYQETLEMVGVQDMAACCSGFLSAGTCNTSFPTCCNARPSSHLVASVIDVDTAPVSFAGPPDPPECLDLPADNASLPSTAMLVFLGRVAAVDSANFCDAALATCRNPPRRRRAEVGTLKIDVCEGVLYRQCSSKVKGMGICYNLQLGRVQCVFSESVIAMREAAIAAGFACDAREEQWLGCK